MTKPISPFCRSPIPTRSPPPRQRGAPLVALESTIITHGMPYPGNLEMARSVEAIIREEGAVPATIAVIHGILHIGLEDARAGSAGAGEGRDEAVARRPRLRDCRAPHRRHDGRRNDDRRRSRRHPCLCDRRHRRRASQAEESFDISADLEELARTGVIVVCAGAKAILDIPKTLEVLETSGVPVVTYDSDDLPGLLVAHFRPARAR